MTRADLIDTLMEMPPGWHSVVNIQMTAWAADPIARRASRQLLQDMCQRDQLEHVYVFHRNAPMLCVLVDHRDLEELRAL